MVLLLMGGVWSGCKPGAEAGGGGAPTIQVVAVTAVRQSVEETLAVVGSLVANEQVEVRSESDGFVESILFREGEDVKEGALLVTLDETRLQAALEESEAALQLSQQTYDRSRELLGARLISNQEFDQAASRLAADEAAVAGRRRAVEEARIRAPFAGVVGARQVSPGQLVTRATTLTWLVDLDTVKVEFNVPERYVGRVRVGQSVEIRVAAWRDRQFRGEVFFVAPFVEPVTRTMLVKAEVPNEERLLKPGMFANLNLTLEVREQAVVIPEAALSQILDGDRATVMVVGAEDTVSVRPVRVGLRLPARVEILEGLEAGERVVVEGLQKVAPGMRVMLAPEASAAPYLPAKT
ncbi:MAG: efflux RND transporter periplasmic adaptor subunit [Verrucomicrobiae bacterium]|nr:efflux RND transporter periplasmic adaptor subunit [Verrucomicrobiae bacterium]